MKVNDIGEFGLIDRISKKAIDKNVLVGIGDDAAVFKIEKGLKVITTDTLVEGDHFRRECFSPKQIGKKAIEINVSDIAAMGGIPKYVLVSLAIPNNLDVSFVEEIYKGMWSVCDKYGIEIIGGNMTHCEKIVISVAMTGEVDKNNLCLRSGAKPGDLIFVTGYLGYGRAGLRLFQENVDGFNKIRKNYLEPKAQLDISKKISLYVNSMIDVSDGLASEMRHICNESKCGAIIYKDKIPINEDVRNLAKKLNEDEYDYALYGGEDFKLLYTLSKENLDKIDGFLIGEITKDKNILLSHKGKEEKLINAGYDHFRV